MAAFAAAGNVSGKRAGGAARRAQRGRALRFWDSSALVPIAVREPQSQEMRALAEEGRELVVWWGTLVECVSAVARGERRGDVAPEQATLALATFDGLADAWREVPPTERIRQTARRLVSVHDIRTADAFQLAAAHAASEERPDRLPFVTLDGRLGLAARREGFPVLP